MAVDYLHRLIVRGAHKGVRTFRRQIYSSLPADDWPQVLDRDRSVLVCWAVQDRPRSAAHRTEVLCDPYEVSAWPIRRNGNNQAEIRYQTRNWGMVDMIRILSRVRPALTVRFLTFCLYNMSIELYRFRHSSDEEEIEYPEARNEFHWNRARIKFGLVGDDVYDDDVAQDWVEEEILHEALNHWEAGSGKTQPVESAHTTGEVRVELGVKSFVAKFSPPRVNGRC